MLAGSVSDLPTIVSDERVPYLAIWGKLVASGDYRRIRKAFGARFTRQIEDIYNCDAFALDEASERVVCLYPEGILLIAIFSRPTQVQAAHLLHDLELDLAMSIEQVTRALRHGDDQLDFAIEGRVISFTSKRPQ